MPDIQCVQFDPATGLGTLSLGDNPKKVTGINLLAQVVFLSFLRNPGQDVLSPREGSGVRSAIGQYASSSTDEVNLLVMQRSKLVETEVLTRQSSAGTVSPAEKLKSLTVLDVASDLSSARVVVKVKITNETGDTTQILV